MRAADHAGVGVIVTTAYTLDPRTIYASGAAAKILGRTRAEILSLPTLRLAPPEAMASLQDIGRRLIAGQGFPKRFETSISRGDGTRTQVDVSFALARIGDQDVAVAFLVDLTERLAARAALHSSEARFKRLIETAPEAVWIADESAIVYANAACMRLFGYDTLDGVIGSDPWPRIHPDDRPLVQARVRQILKERRPSAPYLCRALRRDGAVLELEVSTIAIDIGGRWSALSFGRDVGEKQRLEGQLLQAERLAVLGMLAGGMARAIEKPLSYVTLNLEHLAATLPQLAQDPSRTSEALVRLRETHHGAERIAATVRQMRGFTRQGEAAPVPVDLCALTHGVLELMGSELALRAHVVLRLAPVPHVVVPRERVEQAVLDLIVYVARALPVGGARPDITVSLAARDGLVELAIVVGEGAAVAEPEFLSPSLLAAASVARELGGELVHGAQGLVLRIPCAANAVPAERNAASAAPGERRALRPLITVVDDDPSAAPALRDLCRDHGDVEAASVHGADLRALVLGDGWDLLLYDVELPELSGAELWELLLEARPARLNRVVFIAGAALTPELARFLRSSGAPWIERPFVRERVDWMLGRLLQS